MTTQPMTRAAREDYEDATGPGFCTECWRFIMPIKICINAGFVDVLCVECWTSETIPQNEWRPRNRFAGLLIVPDVQMRDEENEQHDEAALALDCAG